MGIIELVVSNLNIWFLGKIFGIILEYYIDLVLNCIFLEIKMFLGKKVKIRIEL